MKISPLSARDFSAVIRLWKQAEGVGLNESDSNGNLALYLKRNPRLSFVARKGRNIVGAVLCGHDGRRGYLHHLAVARRHRHQGIGLALVDTCLAQLAQAGITRCNIYLYADNTDGEAFWKHNGWVKRKDLCVMQKVVKPSARSACGC